MNKMLRAAVTVLLVLQATVAFGDWMSITELFEANGTDPDSVVAVTDDHGYWAGEVTELEYVEDSEGKREMTGRVKVQIKWITDRTDYECHKIYIMKMPELKDFSHRSLALRECR